MKLIQLIGTKSVLILHNKTLVRENMKIHSEETNNIYRLFTNLTTLIIMSVLVCCLPVYNTHNILA